MSLHFYLVSIQDMSFLLSGLFAFYVANKKRLKKNMFWLLLYNLQSALIAIVSIMDNWLHLVETSFYRIFVFAMSIPHYAFLSLFILLIEKPLLNITFVRIYVIIGISMATLLVFATDYNRPILLLLVNNLSLFFLCCFYFIKLFSMESIDNIKNDFSFWVVSGIFICMCTSLLFVSYRFFLFPDLSGSHTAVNIYILGAVGYILMHLFFLKAYLLVLRYASSR